MSGATGSGKTTQAGKVLEFGQPYQTCVHRHEQQPLNHMQSPPLGLLEDRRRCVSKALTSEKVVQWSLVAAISSLAFLVASCQV